MASDFYSNVLPDFESLERESGQRPGFKVTVVEQDGVVGLLMQPQAGDDGTGVGRAQVFMTPEQGHVLLQGLLEAIDRAETRRSRLH